MILSRDFRPSSTLPRGVEYSRCRLSSVEIQYDAGFPRLPRSRSVAAGSSSRVCSRPPRAAAKHRQQRRQLRRPIDAGNVGSRRHGTRVVACHDDALAADVVEPDMGKFGAYRAKDGEHVRRFQVVQLHPLLQHAMRLEPALHELVELAVVERRRARELTRSFTLAKCVLASRRMSALSSTISRSRKPAACSVRAETPVPKPITSARTRRTRQTSPIPTGRSARTRANPAGTLRAGNARARAGSPP